MVDDGGPRPARDQATRRQLEAVIAGRRFRLAYQPIVHLETGTVAGVEALCRFDDGAATEPRFQRCETLGLAPDLDFAIIDVVLADVAQLPGEYVSINLSPSTLLDPRLSDRLLASDVAARVVIEVTEHARIADYERAQQLLSIVRRGGVRLAVDDAGAGYATFRHILSLRPDIIKMDRSITQDIDSDTARRALATALAAVGAEIGATVVAEGVETEAEVEAVRRAGIHRAQGFVLAPPGPLPLAPVAYAAQPPDGAQARLRAAMDAVGAASAGLEEAVADSREAGMSWGEIAEILGMTRQGVAKRYRARLQGLEDASS